MKLADLLHEIVACIFDNGGGQGGDVKVDRSAVRANEHPSKLTPEDLERLMNTRVGYFFTEVATLFSESRTNVWRCLAQHLEADPEPVPDWFISTTPILSLVVARG